MAGALDIALSGLRSSQIAIDVTSHNVANANVEGFTRQRVNLATATVTSRGDSIIGGGATVASITRVSDRFISRHIREQISAMTYHDTLNTRLGEVETVLNETDDNGIGNALNEFFGELSRLADNPESHSIRQTTVNAAGIMASRIRSAHDQLATVSREINLELNYKITDVNGLLDDVGELNKQISAGFHAGANVSDLMDSRDRVLEELASKLGVQVTISNNETEATVTMDGRSLVLTGDVRHLEARADGIYLTEDDQRLPINSGELGALADMRDDVIPRYQADLDRLAGAIITEFNALHQSGRGLDGTTGLPLFTGSSAADLAVNRQLQDHPEWVAASGTGAVGDSANLRAMLDLKTRPVIGATTLEEFHQGMVGGIGAEVKAAASQGAGLGALVKQLMSQRESVNGVSLDEEMVNLIRFQQGYSASARIIQMVQEMMDTVISLGR